MVETPIAPSVEPPIDLAGPAFELSPPSDVAVEPPPVEDTELVLEAAPIGTPLFSEEAVLGRRARCAVGYSRPSPFQSSPSPSRNRSLSSLSKRWRHLSADEIAVPLAPLVEQFVESPVAQFSEPIVTEQWSSSVSAPYRRSSDRAPTGRARAAPEFAAPPFVPTPDYLVCSAAGKVLRRACAATCRGPRANRMGAGSRADSGAFFSQSRRSALSRRQRMVAVGDVRRSAGG